VARFALLRGVLSLQGESSFRGVIERPPVQPDQRKFLSVVFCMASRAIRLVKGRLHRSPVKARPRSQPVLNFYVTFQAFQSPRPSPEIVTSTAKHDTLQLQMRPG